MATSFFHLEARKNLTIHASGQKSRPRAERSKLRKMKVLTEGCIHGTTKTFRGPEVRLSLSQVSCRLDPRQRSALELHRTVSVPSQKARHCLEDLIGGLLAVEVMVYTPFPMPFLWFLKRPRSSSR